MSAPGERGTGRLQVTVLLVLGAGALFLLGLLLYPFLPALVTSAVLATLWYPAHRRFRRLVRQPDLAAFLSTTAVFFLVVLPALGLSVVLIDQVRQGVDWLRDVVVGLTAPGGFITRGLERVAGYIGLEAEELTRRVTDELSGILGLMARRTFTFLSGLGGWLLQAGAALFTLFYFLRDAEGLMRTVKWLIPLDPEATERVVERTRDVIYATVFGNVAVAVVQGALGGLAFWVLGLPASALWGSVMGVLSLLPIVGPALVWVPTGVLLLGAGEIARGIALLAFGTLVISTVDNYLRAVFIGGRAQLHSLLVFFSVLGGLFAFGAVGIFVGPVLFVIALSFLEIARSALDAPAGAPVSVPIPAAGEGEVGIFRRPSHRRSRRPWSRMAEAERFVSGLRGPAAARPEPGEEPAAAEPPSAEAPSAEAPAAEPRAAEPSGSDPERQ